jgi:hypothetical protein
MKCFTGPFIRRPWWILLASWITAGLLAGQPVEAGEVLLDDFETLGTWSHHPDGGNPVALALDEEQVQSGQRALRLTYIDAPPHWGNLQAPVTVPPRAVAIHFWLYLHRAAPEAALHLWLMEADGDAYVARVLIEGQILGAARPGWHSVQVPLGTFRYDPRGNRQRQFLTVNKMLIGCNFGDFEVTLDALKFITQEETPVSAPPRTPDLQVERTERGSVAVLRDEAFPVSGAGSSPEVLAQWLRQGGYGVTFVTAGDLTDPAAFNRTHFDLLVLAHGASYPAAGRDALLAFLQAGGSFFCTGGYAFDRLLVFANGQWQEADGTVTAEQMDHSVPAEVRINTRYGTPGDTMGLEAHQIGVFDPSFLLQRVAFAQTARGQQVIDEPIRWQGNLEGFAAVAMTGSNNPVFPVVYGRWIPLFKAFDRYGRSRGPVGALVHYYAGPLAGSSAAFFGVTNQDIWGTQGAGDAGPTGLGRDAARVFLSVIEALTTRTFLHDLTTDLACYRPGEQVQMAVQVSNFGSRPQPVRVEFDLSWAGQEEVSPPTAAWTGTLAPGSTVTATQTFAPEKFESDFYQVTAYLFIGEECVDEMHTGFVVWDERVLRNGFPLTFRDNYFGRGDRPAFLTGTNQTGMMWFSAHENPLVWAEDFAQMQDYGLNLLRVLHFSPFSAGGYEGRPTNNPLDLKNRPEKLVRQTDAIVQLAQKYQVVLFLSLHDWMDVELTAEELAAQREWNEFWAKRYADVPGLLFDVQNEPSVGLPARPHLLDLWNRFLLERYGSREGVWQAWRTQERPEPFDFTPPSDAWDEVKAHDLERFKVELLNRWVQENVAGVRAGNPRAQVCVGYLPGLRPADKLLGVQHTDFSNMHFYGSNRDFPRQFKIIDRRFAGKGFSLGEFGGREAHDARVQGQTGDRPQESIEHFLLVGHYALGMGAAFVANWDWKDFRDCVFPWGLNHADLTPKPVLQAFRDMTLLFREVEPVYEAPELFLLVPDSHRLGSRWNEVHDAVLHALDLLFAQHVNFGVINEYDLKGLPRTARALLWPLPYCPEEATFQRVVAFVEGGGALYFSGDVGFDEQRRPTQTARWARLGLPERPPRNPFQATAADWSQEPLRATLPKGQVFFVPYPLEMRPRPENAAVYRAFLDFAGVQRIGLSPDRPDLHVFSLPTREGGRAYVLYNFSDASQAVTLTDLPQPLTLTLRRHAPGFVHLGPDGALRALEAQGPVMVGEQRVLATEAHVMLRTLDGLDLRRSAAVVVMALEPGQVRLATQRPWKALRAEVGEVAGGRWRAGERFALPVERGEAAFPVDPDRARAIFVLAEATELPAVTDRVVQQIRWVRE